MNAYVYKVYLYKLRVAIYSSQYTYFYFLKMTTKIRMRTKLFRKKNNESQWVV